MLWLGKRFAFQALMWLRCKEDVECTHFGLDSPMTLDNDNPNNDARNRSPRSRLRRLPGLPRSGHELPGSMSAAGIAIAIAVAIVVLAGVALATPAIDVLKAYVQRLNELMF